MAQAVGHAVLPIIPSLQGIGKELAKQLNVPASQAADKAASDIRKGMASGVDEAAKAVEKAQWRIKKAAEESADAESKLRAAKEKSAASQASLQAAEAKLSSLRDSEKATSEQLLKAEAEIARKRASVETASNGVAKAERGVEGAMSESKRAADSLAKAQRDLEDAQNGTSKSSKTLTDSVDKSTNSVKGMSVKLGAVAGAVGGVFAGIAQSAVGSFGSLIAGASEASDATDKFKKTLDFAGLDTSAIDAATKRAQDYADQTVYNLGDIQKMTAQLAANGIKDYSGLAEAAGNLNAVAGGNAETFKSVGMVMSQTAGVGKLTTENWNQLSDAIPGAAGKIQESLLKAGAYTGNFRDAMTEGEITADEFNKAIMELGTEPVAVEAAKSTQTFEGMLGNLRATIEGGLANAFNQLKPYIEDFVNGLSKLVEGALPLLVTGIKTSVSVLKWLAEAFQNNMTWIKPLAATVGVLAGAYGVLAVQAKIAATAQAIMAAGGLLNWFKQLTVVTKLQTAAQGALNLVMNANPIFLIGTAIAALVAGLVVFFTKTETGKKVWQSMMDALSAAWAWLKDTFTPVFQWIGDQAVAAWNAMKAGWDIFWQGIQTAWNSFILPVFNAFLTVAKYTIGAVGTLILAPLMIAWNLLSAAFQAGWEYIIKPAWDGLVIAAQFMWNSVLNPIFTWIAGKWSELGSAISLIWNTVIKVAWDAIQIAAQFMWNNVLNPVFTWIKNGFAALGQLIVTIWQTVIKPAWDMLQVAAQFMWNNVLMPVFNAIKAGFTAVGNLIRFIYDTVIKPTWDALSVAIRWLNDNVFQPVMNALKRGWSIMGDLIRNVANSVIHPVFDGLKRGVSIVRDTFATVVDGIGRIWDKLRAATARPVKFVIDSVWNKGIVGAWNKIAGFVPGLDKVSEFKPGWMGAYKTGGVLPGYTPGRDVHDFYSPTGGRLMLSGGEAIMRPEWTRAVGGPAAVEEMNRAARSGKLTPKRAKDNEHIAESHSHYMGGVLQFASGGVVPAMTRIVQQKYPHMQMTSGYRPSNDYHGAGLAGDFSDGFSNTPAMLALANDIANTYPGSLELIHEAPGFNRQIKNGQFVGPGGGSYGFYAGAGDHRNHVHWAMNVPPTLPFGGGVFKGGSGGGGLISSALGWIAEKARGIWDKAMEPIKKKISGTWDGVKDSLPAKIPGGVFKTVKDKAWDFIKSKFPIGDSGSGYNGPVGAGVEQWRGLVDKILKAKGLPTSLSGSVLRRMNQESGGNPRAINNWDSNAAAGTPSKGLMQVIDPTFQAHKDPGFDNIWDPEANIRASMNYAISRYGSLPAAYDRAGGYALGGVLPENLALFDSGGMLQPNMVATNKTNKPEPVFTAEQWNVIRRSIVSKAEARDWRGMFDELGKAINKFGVVANKLGQRAQTDFGRWQRGEHIMTANDKRLATPNEMRLQLGYMMGSEFAGEVGKIFGFNQQMVNGLLGLAGFRDPKLVDETGQVTVQAQSVAVEPTGKASIAPAAAQPKNAQQGKPAVKRPEDSAPVIKIGNVTIHGGATQADAQRFVRGVQSEWERVRGRMARVN